METLLKLNCVYTFLIFQMLCRCPEEERVDEDGGYLVSFWCHEVRRTFIDRILNVSDVELFNSLFKEHIETVCNSFHFLAYKQQNF